MKTIIIKSQRKFDQLRDDAGDIKISAHLKICCQVYSHGGNVSTDGGDIFAQGGHIFTHGGNIFMDGGEISTYGWNIATHGGHIATEGGRIITHGGHIVTEGGSIATQGGHIITHGGSIATRGGNVTTHGGYITTQGGNISTQGGELQCRMLYWRLMARPAVPADKMHVGKVWPDGSCREYWEERLGTKLPGCYEDIEEQLEPLLPDLLKLDKWTSTERWILESHLPKKKGKPK